METATVDSVREELLKSNENFKSLVEKHEKYEKRLEKLAELTYPNDEEALEETTLKKKKLLVKDEIYSIISQHSDTVSN